MFRWKLRIAIVGIVGLALLTASRTTLAVSDALDRKDAKAERFQAWVYDSPPSLSQTVDLHPRIAEVSNRPGTVYPEPLNGYWLVFASVRDGNWEIYADDWPWIGNGVSDAQRLTYNVANDLYPNLHAASQRIIFASNRDGQYELYSMNWNGSNLRRLTYRGGYDAQPAWSPDGSKIVFVSDEHEGLDIYSMNADGNNIRRLTHNDQPEFNPSWSADGSQITYVQAINNTEGVLRIMNADGSNNQIVSAPLAYLQHPHFSPDGSMISMDLDYYHSGWSKLAYYRLSDHWVVPLGSQVTNVDSWAGPWLPPKDSESTRFVNANLKWIYDDGWYIESSCISYTIPSWSGVYCIPGSVLELYPDARQVDTRAPETWLAPLPRYVRAGPLTLTVNIIDDRYQYLYGTYLNKRAAGSTSWSVAGFSSAYPSATFNLNLGAGQKLEFFSQGVDLANNYENFPAQGYDAYLQVYAWELEGIVRDQRDAPLPALVSSSPGLDDMFDSADAQGVFHRYVPVNGTLTVDVSAPGFEPAQSRQITASSDQSSAWRLLPQGDLLVNGGFEQGFQGWSISGEVPPMLVSPAHDGSQALRLGTQDLATNVQDLTPDQWFAQSPVAVRDSSGKVHLVWNESNIYYLSYAPGGEWEEIEIVPMEDIGSAFGQDISVAADGTLHLAYVKELDDENGVYYMRRSPTGIWSEEEKVGGPAQLPAAVTDQIPQIVLDSQDRLYLAWCDQDGGHLITRPSGGIWSAPESFAPLCFTPQMELGPSDTIHLEFMGDGEAFYRTRSSSGTWSALQALGITHISARLALDPTGTSDLFFIDANAAYWMQLQPGGTWSTPQRLPVSEPVYQIAIASSGSNMVVLAGDEQLLESLFIRDGQLDSIAQPVRRNDFFYGMAILLQGETMEGFWSIFDDDIHGHLETGTWNATDVKGSSLSQQVSIPAGSWKPTLAWMQRGEGVGSNGAYSVRVNDQVLYDTGSLPESWEHKWLDLSPWKGQNVTITWHVENGAGQGALLATIDTLNTAEWLTPVVGGCSPGTLARLDGTPVTLIITGENFHPESSVHIGGVVSPLVVYLDETTLQAQLPPGLVAGDHDIWVTNPGGNKGYLAQGVRIGQSGWLPILRK